MIGPTTTEASHGTPSLHDDHSRTLEQRKALGQKAPFKLKEIPAIRVRLQLASRHRDLALFNLAIDSKLRASDLVKLRVRDVCHGAAVASRATVLQQKTQRPAQFEITEPTREAVTYTFTFHQRPALSPPHRRGDRPLQSSMPRS